MNPWELAAMDQSRGMHAEQEYIFHGPPPVAGDRLVGTSRIAEIHEKTLAQDQCHGEWGGWPQLGQVPDQFGMLPLPSIVGHAREGGTLL